MLFAAKYTQNKLPWSADVFDCSCKFLTRPRSVYRNRDMPDPRDWVCKEFELSIKKVGFQNLLMQRNSIRNSFLHNFCSFVPTLAPEPTSEFHSLLNWMIDLSWQALVKKCGCFA